MDELEKIKKQNKELEKQLNEIKSKKYSYIESMGKLGKNIQEIKESEVYQKFENDIVDTILQMKKETIFPDHFPKVRFYSDDK